MSKRNKQTLRIYKSQLLSFIFQHYPISRFI